MATSTDLAAKQKKQLLERLTRRRWKTAVIGLACLFASVAILLWAKSFLAAFPTICMALIALVLHLDANSHLQEVKGRQFRSIEPRLRPQLPPPKESDQPPVASISQQPSR